MSSPADLSNTVPVKPGQLLAGKYRVDRLLGAGGMGFVVAATNIHLSKAVALKMMLPSALSLAGAVERFEREARAAVQLKSQHVAQVLDIGHDQSRTPYIVMELLEGKDFEQLVLSRGPLPIEEVVEYVLQACEAIAEAHSVGIVHRDLKLKNLFLTRRLDGSALVKVLDFGISKWTVADVASHSLTKTTDVMGSPNYMSPEQVRSARDVDHRTDVWSLGVVLFELLTGRVPFLADTLPALCAMVLEQPAPNVSSLRADLPDGIGRVIARCLEKNPADRYPSIGELICALEPYGPVRSRPVVSPHASTLAMGARIHLATPAAPQPSELANTVGTDLTTSQSVANAPTTTVFGDIKSRTQLTAALAIGGALLLCAMVAMLWLGVSLAKKSAVSPDAAAPSASAVASIAPSSAPTSPQPSSTVATSPRFSELEPEPAAMKDAGIPSILPATATTPPPPVPARVPRAATTTPRASAAPRPSAVPAPRSSTPGPSENPFEPTDRK